VLPNCPGLLDLLLEQIRLTQGIEIRIKTRHAAVPILNKAIQRHGHAGMYFPHETSWGTDSMRSQSPQMVAPFATASQSDRSIVQVF
jgi:hypothetical protein